MKTPDGGASVDLIALTCFISLFVVFVVLTRGGPARATQLATQRAVEAMGGSELLSHGLAGGSLAGGSLAGGSLAGGSLTKGVMAVAGAVQSVAGALTGGNEPCSSGIVERFRADPRTQIQHGTIFVRPIRRYHSCLEVLEVDENQDGGAVGRRQSVHATEDGELPTGDDLQTVLALKQANAER